jgi:DNA invertase Pin-like site-specific DNA recombinase
LQDRPQLTRALEELRDGEDTLVVARDEQWNEKCR